MGPPGAIFVVLSLCCGSASWCGCLLGGGFLVGVLRLFGRGWASWGSVGAVWSCPRRHSSPLGAAQFSMVDAATSRQSSHTCARSLTECSLGVVIVFHSGTPYCSSAWPRSVWDGPSRARALATSLEVAASVPKRPIMHQKASCFTLLHRCSASALKFNLLGE